MLGHLLLQDLPDDLLPEGGDCDIFVLTGWVVSIPTLKVAEEKLRRRSSGNNSRVWLLINQEYPTNDLVRSKLKHIYVDKAVILGNWWNDTTQELVAEDLASLWVPFASTVFADRKLSTPLDLLDRRRSAGRLQKYIRTWKGAGLGEGQGTIAYQQRSCATNKHRDAEANRSGWRNYRERFWDRVNELLAKQGGHGGYAIGQCNGEKHLGQLLTPVYNKASLDARRGMPEFLERVFGNISVGLWKGKMTFSGAEFTFTKYDESAVKYSHFRFVVSLENTLNSVGYITEKVMDSLLAGAIPVYAGCDQAPDVIDPRSYLLLKPGQNDQEVAERVVHALMDPAEYDRMMMESAISEAQLRRFFSWHPAVWPAYGDGLRRRIVAELQRLCRQGR
ncbi:unnamed protein product [Prorocentrum cordatum]|uniref:Fucosyltransferase n=1 Tax=Prorocentrum cordatum TaxID=2364126 RepID=A0ABN9Q8W3_9DINO|nr:unnamed protein product [Polarella glacialis]